MKLFKEIGTLIKWLFTSKPSDFVGKDLEVVTMKYFPLPGSRYMFWCGRIITKSKMEDVINRFLTTESGKESKTHEGGHCTQGDAEPGNNWIRYYWMYFLHWIKHLPFIPPFEAAYYCNRYEVEAYANQGNPEYWANYTRANLKGKYSIKGARKLYKELGRRNWKTYIKTL